MSETHVPTRATLTGDPAERVQCPKCKRTVRADMLYDLTGVPQAVRGQHVYQCDGCRDTLFREGKLKRSDYAVMVGGLGAAERAARYLAKENARSWGRFGPHPEPGSGTP